MFCPTCGNALTQQLKYCNRCGANLATTDVQRVNAVEKRLDEYLDGIFWITIFGLGFLIGGMVLMKKLHFSDTLIVAFMALVAAAFLTNLVMNLREVKRMKRSRDENERIDGRDTSRDLSLPPVQEGLALPSVTENTTRNLDLSDDKVPLEMVRASRDHK